MAADSEQTTTASFRIVRLESMPVWLVWLILLLTVFLLYGRAIDAPFLLDDVVYIRTNQTSQPAEASAQHEPIFTWPMLYDARALPQITMNLNQVWSGHQTWSYHLVNFTLHAFCGILLFHLIRLALACATAYPTGTRNGLALAISWLWVIHPLASQPVIYIVQRAEIMASLAYMLTLYSITRAACSVRHRIVWQVLAVLVCVIGFYCKPIVATLPIAALLWDWILLTGQFKITLRRRWPMYLSLLLVCLIMLTANGTIAILTPPGMQPNGTSAGLSVSSITPLAYLFTQSRIILHYLWLCVWPMTLVFDYGWPPPVDYTVYWPSFCTLTVLLLVTVGCLWTRYSKIGLISMLFFLILAPTSSIVPIADLAVEHRMYLPLACVIALLVLVAYRVLHSLPKARLALLVVISLMLMGRCYLRVGDYRSVMSLWKTVIDAVPYHPRAYCFLGDALEQSNQPQQAIIAYERTIAYASGVPSVASRIAHIRLGALMLQQQQTQKAIAYLKTAQTMNDTPEPAVDYLLDLAHRQEAAGYATGRQWPQAVACYEKLIAQSPENAALRRVYAWLLATCPDASFRDGERAIQLVQSLEPDTPDQAVMRLDILAAGHAAIGQFDEAIRNIDQAIAMAKAAGNDHLVSLLVTRRDRYAASRPYLLP